MKTHKKIYIKQFSCITDERTKKNVYKIATQTTEKLRQKKAKYMIVYIYNLNNMDIQTNPRKLTELRYSITYVF